MIHALKTWPEYFEAIETGEKKFEIRKDDRNFEVGDKLLLQEWDPISKDYTGFEITRKIDYILKGGQFGIEEGYVVMSIDELAF